MENICLRCVRRGHLKSVASATRLMRTLSDYDWFWIEGGKKNLLVDKTENLRSQAQDFRQQGTKIRRQMWYQNMKLKLIVLGTIIALILLVILSTCHGFKCT